MDSQDGETIVCPHCAKPSSPGFAFCPFCGGGLKNRVPPPPPPASSAIEILDDPVEEVVVEEVRVEEVLVCWRCDLHNPTSVKICVHCEASLKLAKGKGPGKRLGRATRKVLVSSATPAATVAEPGEASALGVSPTPGVDGGITPQAPPLAESAGDNPTAGQHQTNDPGKPPPAPQQASAKTSGQSKSAPPAKKPKAHGGSHLFAALAGYGLTLTVSIIYALIIGLSRRYEWEIPESLGLSVQLIDTVVILWLVFYCKVGPFGGARKWFGRLVAVPALLSLLCGNILYSDLRRRLMGAEDQPRDREPEPIDFVGVVSTSIQPGIIEELFCRHILQGVLQKLTGPHLAIWVSGAMFALLHIFNPLALPYLFLVGVALGYIRYWSGSLVLVMVLHALHNFGVMLMSHYL